MGCISNISFAQVHEYEFRSVTQTHAWCRLEPPPTASIVIYLSGSRHIGMLAMGWGAVMVSKGGGGGHWSPGQYQVHTLTLVTAYMTTTYRL